MFNAKTELLDSFLFKSEMTFLNPILCGRCISNKSLFSFRIRDWLFMALCQTKE